MLIRDRDDRQDYCLQSVLGAPLPVLLVARCIATSSKKLLVTLHSHPLSALLSPVRPELGSLSLDGLWRKTEVPPTHVLGSVSHEAESVGGIYMIMLTWWAEGEQVHSLCLVIIQYIHTVYRQGSLFYIHTCAMLLLTVLAL